MKERWDEITKDIPKTEADKQEATKLVKAEVIAKNKEKLEKFLNDLGIDK